MPGAQETDDEGEDDTRDNQVSLHCTMLQASSLFKTVTSS
jgi:hypothetical protein